jgi:hypothetical protein
MGEIDRLYRETVKQNIRLREENERLRTKDEATREIVWQLVELYEIDTEGG